MHPDQRLLPWQRNYGRGYRRNGLSALDPHRQAIADGRKDQVAALGYNARWLLVSSISEIPSNVKHRHPAIFLTP
jgi:hypothetical protein